MSKLGTDEFDLQSYRELCNESRNKVNKLIDSLKTTFADCADEDVLKVADILIDFVKSLTEYQCNLDEKELKCE